jgi:uncharacterized protein
VGFLFSGPINIDTVEAISRSYTYASANAVEPPPALVLQSLIRRNRSDVRVLDRFWRLKQKVYRYIINSRRGVLADYVCQYYMRRNIEQFARETYFFDEATLRKEHPRLFTLLKKARDPAALRRVFERESPAFSIEFDEREFFVDPTIPFGGLDQDWSRYRQRKSSKTLRIAELLPLAEHEQAMNAQLGFRRTI